MDSPEFRTYLGVDQTGAARRGGRATVPLPAVVGRWKGRELQITVPAPLAVLDRRAVEAAVGPFDGAVAPVALVLDCVFGLSRAVHAEHRWAKGVRRVLDEASRFVERESGALYGRRVSEAFFATIAPRDGSLPRRACEGLAKANSVFTTRPFQKNVQTGTFRMWRELGASLRADGDWLGIWPFEASHDARPVWIFEGFPSLLWREGLGLRTRDRTVLRGAAEATAMRRGVRLAVADWAAVTADPELADAFVLAFGAALLDKDGRLRRPFAGFDEAAAPRAEGWIVGLEPKAETSP